MKKIGILKKIELIFAILYLTICKLAHMYLGQGLASFKKNIMVNKISLLFIFANFFFSLLSSQNICDLKQSNFSELNSVNIVQMKCIAKKSDKNFTLFYTFAAWCGPCIEKLPDAIKFSEDENIDLYILLIDRESDNRTQDAINYLNKIEINHKVVILSDSLYPPNLRVKTKNKKGISIDLGISNQKKYSNFVKLITPAQFEKIDDMSKYIILNKHGEVIFVSNYKDHKNKEDYTSFLNKMKVIMQTDNLKNNRL